MSSVVPPEPEKQNEPKPEVPKTEGDRFENFFGQATSNTRDIIAYILLVLGIILLFVQHLYGGFIIGLVAGIYFSKEIIQLIKNFEDFIDRQGLARSIVLGATVLAFFILAPAIFIGAAVIVLLRMFIFNEKSEL